MVNKWTSTNRRMNYGYSTIYLRTLVNSTFPRVKGGFCLHGYPSGIRDLQLSSISGWCMRRYPVIEIRYTSAFTVSSWHNNARSINSTREKSADGVYIDIMPVRFYAIYRVRKLNFICTRKWINCIKSGREMELTIFSFLEKENCNSRHI